MKKKMLTATMALTMTAFAPTAYAAEPEVTAEELFRDAAVYLTETDQVQINMTTDNAGSLSLVSENSASSSSFGGAAKGSAQITCTSDPVGLYMSGELTAGALGISYKCNGELYLTESEDGAQMDLYANMNIGSQAIGWVHEGGAAEDFWSEFDVSSAEELKKRFSDELMKELPDLPIEWNVEEQADTYEVSLNQNLMDLYKDLEKELDGEMQLSEEEREIFNEVASCIVLDVKAVFDKETHALESLKLDLGNSDVEALGEKMTELLKTEMDQDIVDSIKNMLVGFELENAYMELTCSYEDVPEITVPQEVIDEAAEQETQAMENTAPEEAAEAETTDPETTDAEAAEEIPEAETIAPEAVLAEELSEN